MSGWVYEIEIVHPSWRGLCDPSDIAFFNKWVEGTYGVTNYGVSAGQWRYHIKEFWLNGKTCVRMRFRKRRDAQLFALRWR